ncbi:hypothetical protein T02_7101 [Trichinella nativa]|uniref:Secreted protein n=1 Tax=Trichinella nativa TaxID=6335 RepID=A0A0V1KM98_9BILA|nr:hypothetical protein T02_7101 [Trichinella nativa]
MLRDIVRLLFHNASVQLLSLLKVLHALITSSAPLCASARVGGSCSRMARYTSLDAAPPARSATKSRSDTHALIPNFATSSAHCLMIWLSR